MDFYRLEEKGPFSLANATVVVTLQHNTQLKTIVRTDPLNTEIFFEGQKWTPVLVEKATNVSVFKCSAQTSVENYPCLTAIAF